MALFTINIKKVRQFLGLFKYAYGRYRWQIALTTVLGFIGGLAGGIGISVLIPLFAFVSGNSGSATDSISKLVQSIFSFFHLSYKLPYLLLFMFLLLAAKAVILFWANYTTVKMSNSYLEETRTRLINKTFGASWPFLINQKVGYLDRVIIDDTVQGSSIFRNLSEAFLRTTSLIVYAVIAFKISAIVTLVTLVSGLLLFFATKPLFYRLRVFSRELNLISKKTSHFINENMIGMKTLKTTAVQSEVSKQGRYYFDALKKGQLKMEYFGYIQGALFEPAVFLFIALLLLYSYRTPNFNIASFAVIIYLIEKIYLFIQNIQNRIQAINTSVPYLDAMISFQKEAERYQESSTGNKPFKFNNKLTFNDITFRYPEKDEHAISGISFSVNKGELVGIIGPSGAGKTTLVDLVLRLLSPDTGSIDIDGVNAMDFNLTDWRKYLGYVSQDVFLFNDTLEANIRFYEPSITHDDIIRAAKTANIFDYIESLPNKFETVVGERGLKLSGGQRQRIALARVLARKPEVMILDEATSSLDNESEGLIQKAITELKGKITVIIIAHRLSTVMGADKLIVLEKGRVVETGSPDELMKQTDSYLYKSYHLRDT